MSDNDDLLVEVLVVDYFELHDAMRATLRQWEHRGGDFNAGDAATDVLAVLVELGMVDQ